MYHPGELPITCTWRRSRRAAVCDAKLWKQRRTCKGELKDVPETVYSTQSFESWLHYFLGRSEIEDLLEQDYQRNIQRQHTAPNIQDSPAWRGLGGFVLSRYHLVWSIYIDWFNPYTRKIAGKTVSCGAIILYCLNLPVEVRFLLKNIFILGMIPAPSAPDVWTISHILVAVSKIFIDFADPGKLIATFRNPNGVLVAARLLPLLADLQAIRKIAGYMAVNAICFCSSSVWTRCVPSQDIGPSQAHLRH
ncbi:hypothetical protein DFH08DRAFT_683351 [Mycena albidolilacea]|uniref:Uncharacterized protein n=1 Tax=Mycena albidolilacea TaxID=1033008 RepID=A0AAD7AMK7_9AGAR|nr:hypothetical protein DFH08DRAFT_683351 [Mycena albidolilacea]